MLLTLLKCKIHMARLTACEPDYEGSIAIDAKLMQAAGLLPHEQVDVLNANNGARLTTYVIEAPAGSGTIALNGPAGCLALPGDEVIILAYAHFTPQQAQTHQPTIILMDEHNNPRLKATPDVAPGSSSD